MNKSKNWMLLILTLLAMTFFSCDVPADVVDNDSDKAAIETVVKGYWKSSFGDGFEVTGTKWTSYADAEKTVTYTADILKVLKDSATAGGYVMKIATAAGDFTPTVGKYYVVRWKDYSLTTIKQSSPFKADKESNGLDTAEAAEKEYTVANGYYGFFADYAKQ